MKNVLLIALASMAVSSYAVSFTWGSSAQVKFGETILNTTSAQATASLVYLGSDGAWSFGEDASGSTANVTDTVVASATTKTSGSTAVKGKYGPTSYGVDQNQGWTYSVLLSYNDGKDTWFNLSSSTFTVDPSLLDNATGISATFDHSATVNSTGVEKLSASSVGSGWYKIAAPVPEPATGALALAGIALLLKRRKTVKA